jgi:hypothetical protein
MRLENAEFEARWLITVTVHSMDRASVSIAGKLSALSP